MKFVEGNTKESGNPHRAEYITGDPLSLRVGIITFHVPFEQGILLAKDIIPKVAASILEEERKQSRIPIRLSSYITELTTGIVRMYITPFSRPEYQSQMKIEEDKQLVFVQHASAVQNVVEHMHQMNIAVEPQVMITGAWRDPYFVGYTASALFGLNAGYTSASKASDYSIQDVQNVLGHIAVVRNAYVCSAGGIDEIGNMRELYTEPSAYVAFGKEYPNLTSYVDQEVPLLTQWARDSHQDLFVVQDYGNGIAYTIRRQSD